MGRRNRYSGTDSTEEIVESRGPGKIRCESKELSLLFILGAS